MSGLIFTDTNKCSYKIIRYYKSGGNSKIYICHKRDQNDTKIPIDYLFKCANTIDVSGDQLRKEIYFYHTLCAQQPRLKAIAPRCVGNGVCAVRNMVFLIIEKHGHSLRHLLQQQSKFKPCLVVQFGIEILDALSIFQQLGIVHKDLRLSNMILTKTMNILFIDWGQYDLIIKHWLNNKQEKITGTKKINSRNQMHRQSCKLSDNLENFIYCLTQMFVGKLDWDKEANDKLMNQELRHESIIAKKEAFLTNMNPPKKALKLRPLIDLVYKMIGRDNLNLVELRMCLTQIFEQTIVKYQNNGPCSQLCIVCARIFVCDFAYDKNIFYINKINSFNQLTESSLFELYSSNVESAQQEESKIDAWTRLERSFQLNAFVRSAQAAIGFVPNCHTISLLFSLPRVAIMANILAGLSASKSVTMFNGNPHKFDEICEIIVKDRCSRETINVLFSYNKQSKYEIQMQMPANLFERFNKENFSFAKSLNKDKLNHEIQTIVNSVDLKKYNWQCVDCLICPDSQHNYYTLISWMDEQHSGVIYSNNYGKAIFFQSKYIKKVLMNTIAPFTDCILYCIISTKGIIL